MMTDEERREKEALKERLLAQRQKIVAQLEAERGTKVITLIHRREPWSEDDDSITIEDSEFVLMEIHKTPPAKPLDLIIHTPGGIILSAEMIAMALKHHEAKVTAIVPFYALSGGTLIALAADEILMEKFSILGPLDPQIQGVPAASLLGLLAQKPLEAIADETIVYADIAEKAIAEVKAFVQWLLQGKLPKEKAAQLADFLTGGYVTHDTPISLQSVESLGLPVREGLPPLVFELFSTCEFGLCKRPCIAPYGRHHE